MVPTQGAVVVAVLAQGASQGPSRNDHTELQCVRHTFSAGRNHICFLRVLGQDGRHRVSRVTEEKGEVGG